MVKNHHERVHHVSDTTKPDVLPLQVSWHVGALIDVNITAVPRAALYILYTVEHDTHSIMTLPVRCDRDKYTLNTTV